MGIDYDGTIAPLVTTATMPFPPWLQWLTCAPLSKSECGAVSRLRKTLRRSLNF